MQYRITQVVLMLIWSYGPMFHNKLHAAGPIELGLGIGYETISGLTNSQNENLVARVSLAKETFHPKSTKFSHLSFGFEIAARNGFYGPLATSDEAQDSIGGPAPIISSGPRIELLSTARKYINDSKLFTLGKLGFDFSIQKVDRCDFSNSIAVNFLGYIGFGLEISKKSAINITASGSTPLSQLKFPGDSPYSMHTPYTQIAGLISWVTSL